MTNAAVGVSSSCFFQHLFVFNLPEVLWVQLYGRRLRAIQIHGMADAVVVVSD